MGSTFMARSKDTARKTTEGKKPGREGRRKGREGAGGERDGGRGRKPAPVLEDFTEVKVRYQVTMPY